MGSRIKWIQVAKGIGIILVILGHTLTTPLRENSAIAMKMYEYIYSFHMAFFFYLSGRTYILGKYKKEYTVFTSLKKNSSRLLIPGLSYAIIAYFLFAIISILPVAGVIAKGAGYELQPVTEWLLGLLTGNMKYTSHLWFVYALFLMKLLTDVIEKLFYKKWMAICFVISIGFLVASQLFFFPGVEILNRFLLLYIWFVAGIMKDFSFVSLPGAILCGMIGNTYWVFRYCIPISLPEGRVYDLLQRYCDQGVKVFMIIFLVRLSYSISSRKVTGLEYLGNQSFSVYLIHQPFFCSVVSVLLLNMTELKTLPIIGITFIVALSSSLLVIKISNLKRLKKFSGVILGNR